MLAFYCWVVRTDGAARAIMLACLAASRQSSTQLKFAQWIKWFGDLFKSQDTKKRKPLTSVSYSHLWGTDHTCPRDLLISDNASDKLSYQGNTSFPFLFALISFSLQNCHKSKNLPIRRKRSVISIFLCKTFGRKDNIYYLCSKI